jgi:hypothetical protein
MPQDNRGRPMKKNDAQFAQRWARRYVGITRFKELTQAPVPGATAGRPRERGAACVTPWKEQPFQTLSDILVTGFGKVRSDVKSPLPCLIRPRASCSFAIGRRAPEGDLVSGLR